MSAVSYTHLVAPGGIVICESETKLVLPAEVGGLQLKKQYKYCLLYTSVGGLGAVGLAGILHPAQVHLVLGVIGVQLNGAADVYKRQRSFSSSISGWKNTATAPLCPSSPT